MKRTGLILCLLSQIVSADPASMEVKIETSPPGARVWMSQVDREIDTGQSTDQPVKLRKEWFFDEGGNPVGRTFVLRLRNHSEARFKTTWGSLSSGRPLMAEDGKPFRLQPEGLIAWVQDYPLVGGLFALILVGGAAGALLGYQRLQSSRRQAEAQSALAERAQRKALDLAAQQQADREEATRLAKQAVEQTLKMKKQQDLLDQKNQAIQQAGGTDPRLGLEITSRSMGTYVLLKKLGAGAMGAVYEGKLSSESPGSPKKLAIKWIDPDKVEKERAHSEGQVGMQLVHPGIIRCYDYVELNNAVFLLLELVEGGDDMTRLLTVAHTPEQAIQLLEPVAQALDAMHARGFIHRDLKPSNIMTTAAGLKITDMGLAKNPHANFQTLSGDAFGTAQYIAPEQIQDTKRVTPKADQYALGCILYELIEATSPFTGSGAMEMFFAHLSVDPPVPARLNAAAATALLRMLAKKPDERFGSCCEALAAIRERL